MKKRTVRELFLFVLVCCVLLGISVSLFFPKVEYKVYPLLSFQSHSEKFCDLTCLMFVGSPSEFSVNCRYDKMSAEIGKDENVQVRFSIERGEMTSCVILCSKEDDLKFFRNFIKKHGSVEDSKAQECVKP